MEFSVSALSYIGPKTKRMKRLSPEMGVEIFWDWGKEDFWKGVVPELMQGRTGKFSIHGPMMYVAFTDDAPTEKVFEALKKPFDLYHRCDSAFYVLHTHGGIAPGATENTLLAKRQIAEERILRFQEICEAEGVQLVVENIGRNAEGKTVFDETAFIELFRRNPQLKCLLDVGHAVLGGYDISKVQQTLGSQLTAYHLHDNGGKADDHLRIRQGVIDWEAWKKNCFLYTPDAEIVLEYDGLTNEAVYHEDMEWIRQEPT